METNQTVIFVTIAFTLLLLSLVFKKLKQPPVVAYIIAGLLLGKSGFNVISHQEQLMHIGDIGVVLLLFFIGMEMSLDKPLSFWAVPTIGTALQIIFSLMLTSILGYFLNWDLPRIILLGFVISLSSTAVIIKLLQDWGELESNAGQRVIAILLAQDLAVVPMMITINHFGKQPPSNFTMYLQLFGGIAALTVIAYIFYKKTIHIDWLRKLQLDHEGQVFAALTLCFGFSIIFDLLHLSAAFGAFIAGLLVSSTKETQWASNSLSSLKVIFMAIFFVAIGMLMDRAFLLSHWFSLALLLSLILGANTLINYGILKAFKQNNEDAWYCGALLAQVGEFGYILLFLGLSHRLIEKTTYQYGISIITLSLLASPFWASFVKRRLHKAPQITV